MNAAETSAPGGDADEGAEEVPEEVTADMVLEVTAITRPRAERIATYANHRFFGRLNRVDAARETGVRSDRTRQRYEWVVRLLITRFGLPEPPGPRSGGYVPDFDRGRESAMHLAHHGGGQERGCRYCEPGRGAGQGTRGVR
ncbi:hypothetical protein [Actinomadura sp. K4S16]|uniref:hypothetical protein n=1 Tax=Actinomadura sp. K4S16 TaxID=1316147 RepID=UPI0011EC2FDA|nr:hypothetical protein [Actinomadura sp. K4S16]